MKKQAWREEEGIEVMIRIVGVEVVGRGGASSEGGSGKREVINYRSITRSLISPYDYHAYAYAPNYRITFED